MQIEQQKTINHGGKQTGKILGGMAFSGNTAQSTDVGAGNTFVPIGNGNASHPLFELIPNTLPPVEYFSITGTTAATQTLTLTKGTNVSLYLDWSITLFDSVLLTNIQFAFKIVKQPLVGPPVTIISTQMIGTCNSLNSTISQSTLIVLNQGDALSIQLSNIDSISPTIDPIVSSASLIISE